MRAKKYTIIFSGIIAFISLSFYAILHFRLYHYVGIYGNGQSFLVDIREFLMVVSSGLFTSACVTLIVSIREYFDTCWMALRDLMRLVSDINQKFKNIAWYDPKIPFELLRNYFYIKYDNANFSNYLKDCLTLGTALPPEVTEYLEEDQAVMDEFREHIWDNTPKQIQVLFSTEDRKAQYLDEQVPIVEKQIEDRIRLFFDSLQVFRHYDVYQIQSAFDAIDFIFSKKKKDELRGLLLGFSVTSIEAINEELRKLSYNPKDRTDLLYSFQLLNKMLIVHNQDQSEAYSLVEYHIALGKYKIDRIINPKTTVKAPKLEEFNVYKSSYLNSSFEIVSDALLH